MESGRYEEGGRKGTGGCRKGGLKQKGAWDRKRERRVSQSPLHIYIPKYQKDYQVHLHFPLPNIVCGHIYLLQSSRFILATLCPRPQLSSPSQPSGLFLLLPLTTLIFTLIITLRRPLPNNPPHSLPSLQPPPPQNPRLLNRRDTILLLLHIHRVRL